MPSLTAVTRVAQVLACALAAKADFIVSGDKDLLTLKVFREIPIMTAAEAVRAVA